MKRNSRLSLPVTITLVLLSLLTINAGVFAQGKADSGFAAY